MSNFNNKKISNPLVIGILIIPLVFAWFTLRKGYSSTARIISFGWLILGIVLLALLPTPSPQQSKDSETINIEEKTQPSAVVAKTEDEKTAIADTEAAQIRKQYENRQAELAAADKPQFEVPEVDYTTPVTKINIKNDQSILKAVGKPVIDKESATNENGEPMTSYWFSQQPAYGLEIGLSREFIDIAWQFDYKDPKQAAEAFVDGQRITRALLGGKEGAALYENIAKGGKIDHVILSDGTEIKNARCGAIICRYRIIR